MTERCDVCGFEWGAVAAREIPSRVIAAGDRVADVLRAAEPAALNGRSDPDAWTSIEYAAHVRDVLYNLRDRMVVGLVEPGASPLPMYGAKRADLGLYANEEPRVLAAEIELAARLFARTVAALDAGQLAHTIVYGWPRETERTLLWVAAQALHEAEHHADDIARATA